jgi:hypothetical protein
MDEDFEKRALITGPLGLNGKMLYQTLEDLL